jgi:hypothetical protein
MKSKLVAGIMLTLLLIGTSILVFRSRPVEASSGETVVHYVWSQIVTTRGSYNDSDPGLGQTHAFSGELNVTFSPPDANGVINLTIPKESGYVELTYDPINHQTYHIVSISDSYGKLYTQPNGDVDIISMTNDTGTFFKKDGTWHPAAEEWIGDGTPDPAGSAWLTGISNTSVYYGDGIDGPLIASWLGQGWHTTGFVENRVVEPASRLNGFYVNATGVPVSPPYVGGIGTWVKAGASLNIHWWPGVHMDIQSKTDQSSSTPPAFMASLFSPANLYVTDPENRHVGTDPTTGESVNEIPEAFYSGPGSEPQRVIIPNPLDGVYDVQIIGTSTGTYTLVVELATLTEINTQIYTGDIIPEAILKSEVTVSEGEMTPTTPVSTIGDVNVDGIVDIFDLRKCASSFGSKPEDINWNLTVDIAPPYGLVDIFDLRKIAKHYLEHV